MAATIAQATTNTIHFKSKGELENALSPLSLEEVRERINGSNASVKLQLQCDEGLVNSKIIPLRNPGTSNLISTPLYKAKTLTVYYPEMPRVPHHLTIAFHRREIAGISAISEEENRELFVTIKKVAEIYKSISIQGFVVAVFDRPQQGHLDRCVVEIIPHLPGFKDVKNIVDKMECNRYVLFRHANLSPVKYTIPDEDLKTQIKFWKQAFEKDYPPIKESDTKVNFPYVRKESHQLEAEKILFNQLIEILHDKGGKIENPLPCEFVMPTTLPESITSVKVAKCFFCDQSVINRQLVYEYEDILVFYNIRKGAKPGSNFLILPKRHTEKIYGLNSNEIDHLQVVRKALTDVLKETHPECEIIIYTQDDPTVGQTVFHSHEQVVAVDPKTIALTWTMLSLYPSSNVSDTEMIKIREEFAVKLKQKIEEMKLLKEAI